MTKVQTVAMVTVKENYQDILFQLERDARQNFTEIGNKTGSSQQTVSYAIKTMREDRVVKDFYPLFDYTKFGYNGYLVLFRVNTFSREKIQELEELFMDHRMVAWVNRLAGGWDFLIFFLAPNASYFNKQFKQIVSQHPQQLQTYTILTSIVIHDLGRNYLNASDVDERAEDVIVGGDREMIEMKPQWKAVCQLLQENPLESSVSMAEKLDVTPKTIIDRIETLESQNLIKGYRPLIGIQELDVFASMLFVKYNNQDVERENKLRDYCKEHPNVTLFMKTFGDYDAMIRLETRDREEQREVVNSIRERYEDILLDYDTLEIVDDMKKSYLPMDYFRER